MNRPEWPNALGGDLTAPRDEALEDFNADPNMRVGIVTGTGPRVVSAGADAQEMAERNAPARTPRGAAGSMSGWGYSDSPKPFIAAVNGLAIGVLASADAKGGPAAFAEKRGPVWTGGSPTTQSRISGGAGHPSRWPAPSACGSSGMST